MTRWLIVFSAHAMGHVADEDMPAVDEAAHAVSQEAIDAGAFLLAGGLDEQKASIAVAADGTVSNGAYPDAIGGIRVVDVPSREEGLKWAAKIASACRCAEEVWEIGSDPRLEAMLRQAERRRSRPES